MCSWAKFSPGVKSSAGKTQGNGSTGHGNRYLARILGEAGPGEIVVSRNVRDLVAGSDQSLADRGTRRLKGVEGDWQLFAVADG